MANKALYGQESLTTECMNSGRSVVDLCTGRHIYSYPLYAKEGVLGLNLSLVYNSDYYNEQDNAVPCGKGWRLNLIDKYVIGSYVHVDGMGREHPMQTKKEYNPYGTSEFDGVSTRKYLKLTNELGNYYYTDQNYKLLTQSKLSLNQNTYYTFTEGKLYQIFYRNTAVLTVGYDTNGRVLSITDNIDGKVVNFTYNASGYLSTISYPDGKTHTLTYDGAYLDCITSPVGDTDFWYAGNNLNIVQDPSGYRLTFTTSGGKVTGVTESTMTASIYEGGTTSGSATGASKTIYYSEASRRTIVKTNKNVYVEYMFRGDGSLIAEVEKSSATQNDCYYPTIGKAMGFSRNEDLPDTQKYKVPLYCTCELDLRASTKVGDLFTTQTLVNNSAVSEYIPGNPIAAGGGIYVFICWAKGNSLTGTSQYYGDDADASGNAKPKFGIQIHTTNASGQNMETISYTPFQEDVTGWQMVAIPINLNGISCNGLRFEFIFNHQASDADAYVKNGRLYKTSGAINMVYDGDYSVTETEKYSNVTLYDVKGNAVKNILRRKETSGFTTIGTSTISYNGVDDEYVTSQTDRTGATTSYSYNTYLQPTQIVKQSGSLKMLEKKTYTNQILTSETDASNKTVTYTKSNGYLTKAVDGTVTTNYSYFSNGLLSMVSPTSSSVGVPNSFTYQKGLPVKYTAGTTYYNFVYDGFGRITQVKENGTTVKSVTYTDNGSGIDGVTGATDKVKITYANGFYTESYTDKYGNVIQTRENGSATEKMTATYNGEQNLTAVVDNIGKISYNYSYNKGRVTTVTRTSSEVSGIDCTQSHTYNAYGEETEVTYLYNGTSHRYAVTKNEQTQAVTQYVTPIETLNYTYDGLGRLTRKTRSFGKTIDYTYAANGTNSGYTTGRVSRIAYGSDKTWNYTYDANGNIKQITNASGTIVASYEYDAIGRLTRENLNGYKSYVYGYDARGNVTDRKEYAYTTGTLGALNRNYTSTYDNTNRMQDYYGMSCSYDANGNPTRYKGYTATWTRGRLLASYKTGSYAYDANGIRIKKVVGPTTTHYIVNGETILAEYNGTAYKKYFYDESGIAGMIYEGATYYFMKNLQGDVVGVYNSTGTLLGEYVYDAWGRLLNSVTNDVLKANPFRYRGYYYDSETALYYLNSRYYDPEAGRFLNMDGLSYLEPMAFNGLNLYAYCGNNPVMYSDPSGNSAVLIGLLIGLAVGVALGVGYAAYTDYQDDNSINGSIGWQAYVGYGLVGGFIGSVLGAGIGYLLPFINTFVGMSFSIGGGLAYSSGAAATSAGITITGAQVLEGVGVLAGVNILAAMIGKSGGYRVNHYYPNDHEPTHVHIFGDDIADKAHGIRVGLNGNPLPGEPSLPSGAKKALRKLWKPIIEALKLKGVL